MASEHHVFRLKFAHTRLFAFKIAAGSLSRFCVVSDWLLRIWISRNAIPDRRLTLAYRNDLHRLRFFELAHLLDVIHQVTAVDVFHDEEQAILEQEERLVSCQDFLRRFRDPIRVPTIRENYRRVPKIRENRVLRIREIGSLQIHTGYLTFSLKKTGFAKAAKQIGIHDDKSCFQKKVADKGENQDKTKTGGHC